MNLKGKEHRYFPDFKYKGQLIEIKNSFLLEKMRILNTKDNAKLLCLQENNVNIFSDKDMIVFQDYIKSKYGKDYLKQFRNK